MDESIGLFMFYLVHVYAALPHVGLFSYLKIQKIKNHQNNMGKQ